MLPRDEFLERRFPGLGAWLGAAAIGILAASVFDTLLHSGVTGRVIDETTLFVIRPLESAVFFLLAALIVCLALRRSWEATLQGLLPWSLCLFLLPIISWGLAWFGFDPAPGFLNLSHLPIALVTAGFLPQPLAHVDSLLFWLMISVSVGWLVWRERHQPGVAALAGVSVSVVGSLFLAVPSLIGLHALPIGDSPWLVGSDAIQHAWWLQLGDTYWWHNIYERYPIAWGGEKEAAGGLLLASLAWLLLAGLAMCRVWRQLSFHRADWLEHLRLPWFGLLAALTWFGTALAWSQGSVGLTGGFGLVAWALFILTSVLSWLFVIGRNDLADIASDERLASHRPLASGKLTLQSRREANALCLVLALFGGALLGWPVWLFELMFLGCTEAYSHFPLRAKRWLLWRNVVLIQACLAWLLMAWFFATQHVFIKTFPLGLALGLWLWLTSWLLVRDWHLPTDPDGQQPTVRTYWEAKLGRQRASWAMMVVIAVGYLVLPLVAGWTKWYILTLPFGLASMYFFWTQTNAKRWLTWLSILFFVVSGFLLLASVNR